MENHDVRIVVILVLIAFQLGSTGPFVQNIFAQALSAEYSSDALEKALAHASMLSNATQSLSVQAESEAPPCSIVDIQTNDTRITYNQIAEAEKAYLIGTESVVSNYNNLAPAFERQQDAILDIMTSVTQTRAKLTEKQLNTTKDAQTSNVNTNMVDELCNLAFRNKAAGSYDKAEDLYLRALKISEKQYGNTHLQTARCLNNLATIYLFQGRYEDAEPLLLQALEIRKDALGESHSETAHVYLNIARLYESQIRYVESEDFYRLAIRGLTQSLGPKHPRVAAALNDLASLCYSQGRYAEAELKYNEATHIHEQSLGSDHPDTTVSLSLLARLYITQGRYQEAATLVKKILDVTDKPSDIRKMIDAYRNGRVSALCAALGRYGEDDPEYQRFVEESGEHSLLEQIADRVDHASVDSEHDTATFQAYRKTQKDIILAWGREHPNLALGLDNLASAYVEQGIYTNAEPIYLRSLEIQEHSLGSDHVNTAKTLTSLGILYAHIGRNVDAEALFRRALDIQQTVLGPDHPVSALTLSDLANLYITEGRYDESMENLQKVLASQKGSLGPNHPDTAKSMNDIASLLFTRDPQQSIGYAKEAFAAEQRILREYFAVLSEEQRGAYSVKLGNQPLHIAVSVALSPTASDFQATEAAWLMLLRSKGRVLDAMLEDRQRLAGNPEADSLYTRLSETKTRLANLQFRDLSDLDAHALARYREQMEALRREQQQIEQQLARLSGSFREARRASSVAAQEIAKALPSDTALIEFLHITPLIPASSWADPSTPEQMPPQYLAFVLVHPDQNPQLIQVGDAEEINTLIASIHDGMQEGADVADALRDLYRLLWAPLAHVIGDRTRILISPDGNLNFLSFASLLAPDGQYLIEKHDIGYIASARDLVRRFDADGTATNSPALFGDPDFGGGDRAPLAEPKSLTRATTFRSVLSDTDRSAAMGITLARLPASSNEVAQISRLMNKQNPQTYLEATATEERLKTSVRPDILHLATHGFFLPEPYRPDMDRLTGMRMSGDLAPRGPVAMENPMHRSGLALAGAQLALDGKAPSADRDDGIVTAEEVGGLDLWGTRLVVLSACQTGLGETLSGEGVMGLRRAFVQAGARNLLLTLWNIEDETTSELMLAFYRDYLETGDAIGAMSRAQRATLAELAANPQKNHPRFWAPYFVSVQGAEASRE